MGEHSLVLVVATEVKAGKELLLDYGTSHAVGRKRMPGPKIDKKSKTKRLRISRKTEKKG